MRRILILLSFIFVLTQLTLTVLDRAIWPFSNYSMFNRIPPKKGARPSLVLRHSDGTLRTISTYETIPIEFFKTYAVYQRIFQQSSEDKKDTFAGWLLKTMNENQWGAGDEVHRLYNPPAGVKVTGFDLQLINYDFTDWATKKEISTSPGRIIYSTRVQ